MRSCWSRSDANDFKMSCASNFKFVSRQLQSQRYFTTCVRYRKLQDILRRSQCMPIIVSNGHVVARKWSSQSVYNFSCCTPSLSVNCGPTHNNNTVQCSTLFQCNAASSAQISLLPYSFRFIHTSSHFCDSAKSNVEEAVTSLKEETTLKVAHISSPPSEEPDVTTKIKKTIMQRIVAEVKHYYHGFRLLFIDVKVCSRLLWRVLKGNVLTRREHRQLVRTTADLFRLVPFMVFIIIPFMEFLLPVALTLFPGMLPSTFQVESKEKEKLRLKFKAKLEMAKFLQDTVEEMALEGKMGKEGSADEFKTFMKKIRSTGEQTTNEEIMRYSKLFQDTLTLDKLQHGQLIALCKLLELQTIGTSAFLRFQLHLKLRQLQADDQLIQSEGIDELSVEELQEACRARGMRAKGVPKQRLASQLSQWLDLHLNDRVPVSLLLLSRTLYLPENLSPEDQLKATISVLPESTTTEAGIKIQEVEGERTDNKAKLEAIKEEEAALKNEKKQIEIQEVEEARQKENLLHLKLEEDAKISETPVEEILVDKAIDFEEQPAIIDPAELKEQEERRVREKTEKERLEKEKMQKELEKREMDVKEKSEEISPKELEDIEDVLERMADSKSSMTVEKEELEELKEDVSDYKEVLEDLHEVTIVLASDDPKKALHESKAAKNLSRKVTGMIDQLNSVMDKVIDDQNSLRDEMQSKNLLLHEIDEGKKEEVRSSLTKDKEILISQNELMLNLRKIQKLPEDMKFQRILQVLDEDEDGQINVDDALKVIELLAKENVKVKASHIPEILNLIKVEESLKEEEKAKEMIDKMNGKGKNVDKKIET